MANEIELKFGSLNLNSTNEITISAISIKENKDVKVSKIPKADRSVAETARRNSLTVTVKGDIIGSDYDDLRTNLDTLKAGLHNGKQKFTLDDDRYIMGQLKNFTEGVVHLKRMCTWSASFVCEDPLWLAETATVDDRTPTSGTPYNVTNAGNAPVRAKIEFTAPAGGISNDIQFENTTNSELMKYIGDVVATEDVEIDNRYDTDDFQVLNNGVDDHANFEGDFITLEPGVNALEFTGTVGTDVKVTFRAGWY